MTLLLPRSASIHGDGALFVAYHRLFLREFRRAFRAVASGREVPARVAKWGFTVTSNSECLSDQHESAEPYGRRRKNSRGEVTSEALSNI